MKATHFTGAPASSASSAPLRPQPLFVFVLASQRSVRESVLIPLLGGKRSLLFRLICKDLAVAVEGRLTTSDVIFESPSLVSWGDPRRMHFEEAEIDVKDKPSAIWLVRRHEKESAKQTGIPCYFWYPEEVFPCSSLQYVLCHASQKCSREIVSQLLSYLPGYRWKLTLSLPPERRKWTRNEWRVMWHRCSDLAYLRPKFNFENTPSLFWKLACNLSLGMGMLCAALVASNVAVLRLILETEPGLVDRLNKVELGVREKEAEHEPDMQYSLADRDSGYSWNFAQISWTVLLQAAMRSEVDAAVSVGWLYTSMGLPLTSGGLRDFLSSDQTWLREWGPLQPRLLRYLVRLGVLGRDRMVEHLARFGCLKELKEEEQRFLGKWRDVVRQWEENAEQQAQQLPEQGGEGDQPMGEEGEQQQEEEVEGGNEGEGAGDVVLQGPPLSTEGGAQNPSHEAAQGEGGQGEDETAGAEEVLGGEAGHGGDGLPPPPLLPPSSSSSSASPEGSSSSAPFESNPITGNLQSGGGETVGAAGEQGEGPMEDGGLSPVPPTRAEEEGGGEVVASVGEVGIQEAGAGGGSGSVSEEGQQEEDSLQGEGVSLTDAEGEGDLEGEGQEGGNGEGEGEGGGVEETDHDSLQGLQWAFWVPPAPVNHYGLWEFSPLISPLSPAYSPTDPLFAGPVDVGGPAMWGDAGDGPLPLEEGGAVDEEQIDLDEEMVGEGGVFGDNFWGEGPNEDDVLEWDDVQEFLMGDEDEEFDVLPDLDRLWVGQSWYWRGVCRAAAEKGQLPVVRWARLEVDEWEGGGEGGRGGEGDGETGESGQSAPRLFRDRRFFWSHEDAVIALKNGHFDVFRAMVTEESSDPLQVPNNAYTVAAQAKKIEWLKAIKEWDKRSGAEIAESLPVDTLMAAVRSHNSEIVDWVLTAAPSLVRQLPPECFEWPPLEPPPRSQFPPLWGDETSIIHTDTFSEKKLAFEVANILCMLIRRTPPPPSLFYSLAGGRSVLSLDFETREEADRALENRDEVDRAAASVVEYIGRRHPDLTPSRYCLTEAIRSRSPYTFAALARLPSRTGWLAPQEVEELYHAMHDINDGSLFQGDGCTREHRSYPRMLLPRVVETLRLLSMVLRELGEGYAQWAGVLASPDESESKGASKLGPFSQRVSLLRLVTDLLSQLWRLRRRSEEKKGKVPKSEIQRLRSEVDQALRVCVTFATPLQKMWTCFSHPLQLPRQALHLMRGDAEYSLVFRDFLRFDLRHEPKCLLNYGVYDRYLFIDLSGTKDFDEALCRYLCQHDYRNKAKILRAVMGKNETELRSEGEQKERDEGVHRVQQAEDEREGGEESEGENSSRTSSLMDENRSDSSHLFSPFPSAPVYSPFSASRKLDNLLLAVLPKPIEKRVTGVSYRPRSSSCPPSLKRVSM